MIKKIKANYQVLYTKKVKEKKMLLANFMLSCNRNQEIKKWMYEFFTDVFKDIANRQILGRLKSHRLKTKHLVILFDIEYRNLKQQAISMIKL